MTSRVKNKYNVGLKCWPVFCMIQLSKIWTFRVWYQAQCWQEKDDVWWACWKAYGNLCGVDWMKSLTSAWKRLKNSHVRSHNSLKKKRLKNSNVGWASWEAGLLFWSALRLLPNRWTFQPFSLLSFYVWKRIKCQKLILDLQKNPK